MKQTVDPNISFSIRCTFLEIYQEQVRDLLMPQNDSKDIAIREDRNGSITVSGVHEQPVTSAQDLFKCLEAGGIERTTGDTKMHMSSSRSHAVFSLILEQRLDTSKILGMKTDEEDLGFATPASSVCGSRLLRCSKLHLVDLAGSERVKRTGAEGVRLKESVKINSGLLALGNVISVLGEMHEHVPASAATTVHVPYRDSKLTRLLQNSLGGNAKTLMLACVSPCDEDYEETLNTLKYADRARKIQNKPIINTVDHQAVKLASMQERIDFLEAQIKKQTDSHHDSTVQEVQQSNLVHDSSPKELFGGMKEAVLVDMDNDKLIMYFVEELKNRTIRGTNAMKSLQDANNENQRLAQRISDLEERYTSTRLAAETSSNLLKKKQFEYKGLQDVNNNLVKDLNVALDVLDGVKPRTAREAWIETRQALGESNWGQFQEICEAHRPSLLKITDSGDSKDGMFPVISIQHTPTIPVKPTSRINSGKGPRFNRRSSKIVPVEDGPIATQTEAELLKYQQEHQIVVQQLSNISEEREIEKSILEDKNQVIESLRKINIELEAKLNTLESMKHSVHTIAAQTDLPLIALAAEVERPYANMTIPQLVHKISAGNRKIQSQGEVGGIDLGGLDIGQLETDSILHQLSRLDEEEVETFPVHNAGTEMGQECAQSKPPLLEVVDKDALLEKNQIMAELQGVIKAKAELQRELSVRNKEMEKLKHQQHEKILKMDKELEAVNRELAKVTSELEEAMATKDKLKEEHEKKLKSLEGQMTKTKSKLKEQEKALKEKEGTERKTVEIQQEIEKLQLVIVASKKKGKEDAEKLAELDNRRTKDIAALNRAREEDAKKIRQLEVTAEVIRKKLDKKEEELVAMTKRVKDGLAVARVSKGLKTKTLGKSENSNEKETVVETPNEIISVVALDTSPFVQSLEAENERLRAYHTLCIKIREMKSKIDALGVTIQQTSASDQSQIFKFKTERKDLGKDLVNLREQRKVLENSLLGVVEVGKNEELHSTRPTTAESDGINYSELRQEFSENLEALELLDHLKTATLHDCRAIVVGCLRELADLHTLENNFEEESQRSQDEIDGLRKQMAKLKLSFDKKLARLHQEHEQIMSDSSRENANYSLPKIKELSDLSVQTESVPVVEEDAEFYKQTSKDLKLKLRELVALNHNLTQQLERSGSRQSSLSLPKDIAPAAL
ncbi:UNVERIFIED_CONTAM: hypothetical protein HDU68_001242 [Siphonaria sp. JEL0065]|nr:hypothetical protein HDU68_001242 [Siphonaria sp. JEL0065]